MITKRDVPQLFKIIATLPGINDLVKIDFKISRKNIFLLKELMEIGLAAKGDENTTGLLKNLPEETLTDFRAMADEWMQKAELTQFSEELGSLGEESKKVEGKPG